MSEMYYESMLTGAERNISCRRSNGFVDGVCIAIAKLSGSDTGSDIILAPSDARALAADLVAAADEVEPQAQPKPQDSIRFMVSAQEQLLELNDRLEELAERIAALERNSRTAAEDNGDAYVRILALDKRIAALEHAPEPQPQTQGLRCPECGARLVWHETELYVYSFQCADDDCNMPVFSVSATCADDACESARRILGQVKS